MDSNAVVLNFLHHGIINRGDQRTITRTEDPTEQNEFLHLYLKEKCTEDAFHLVCDIISGVKGNPKMSALGTAMKRRLVTGNCVCVCVRVCAHKNHHVIHVYHMNDVGSIDVGCRQSVVKPSIAVTPSLCKVQ